MLTDIMRSLATMGYPLTREQAAPLMVGPSPQAGLVVEHSDLPSACILQGSRVGRLHTTLRMHCHRWPCEAGQTVPRHGLRPAVLQAVR